MIEITKFIVNTHEGYAGPIRPTLELSLEGNNSQEMEILQRRICAVLSINPQEDLAIAQEGKL